MIKQPELLLTAALALALLAGLLLHLRARKQNRRREQELARANEDAQRRLRSSMSDTRAMLDQGSAVIMVFDRVTLTLLFANRQALELFDCDTVEQLSDTVLMRPDAWQPSPYSLLDFERWTSQLKASGFLRQEWLFSASAKAGIWMDCYLSNTVFEGRPARTLSANNIHAYKMNQAANKLRNRILTGINSSAPMENLADSLCKLAEIRLQNTRCLITRYDQQRDSLTPLGNSGLAKAFRETLPAIPARYGSTSIGTAAYTRNRTLCESILDDHRWQGYTRVVADLGLRASWSEPIVSQRDELLGVVTVFSHRPRNPDEQQLDDLASIVSLTGLAIERKQWQRAMEAAAASERFIRQMGVDLVNLPSGEEFEPNLRYLLHRVVSHYELGALALWERGGDDQAFACLATIRHNTPDTAHAENPGAAIQPIAGQVVTNMLQDSPAEYLTPQDALYDRIRLSDEPKPILLTALNDEQGENSFIGFLAVQSRFIYIAQATIDHLQVIGSMVRTVLLNRRLVHSLASDVENEQRQRKKLEGELSVARSIQMSMVPGAGHFREQYRNWTIEAWLQPARAVGGDLYELIRLPSGNLLIAVGDVSDKGAPAALFMARTVSLLNYLARSMDGDLAGIARALNNELCRSNEACMFVTMVMGVLELGTGEIKWLNAGHNAPMFVDNKTSPKLWPGNPAAPFGVYEDVDYAVASAKIGPDQSITLYSDGVTEAFDQNGQEFGEERLLNLGYRAANQGEGLLTYMREQLLSFAGSAPQSDDITLLTIQRHGTIHSVERDSSKHPAENS
ncbi:GAF domain-containing SpoIIE family protein phosphatase [Marinobacter sp.]|uniref:GAF domain-containing SpoIIE family protein phosphatase n=1 Tax=Marinobacter sp. TaxID=50741 RepID=UPI001A02EE32|nr:GAF domain-containing SpoIIE family protein phosphatase [Marinobacter sp.]MBE0486780.1 SpoIIE family protein phosphatase [Marinobacter sp.]